MGTLWSQAPRDALSRGHIHGGSPPPCPPSHARVLWEGWVSPTISCAQGVILLGARVLGKGDPILPAPGEAVQAGVRRAAPATRVLLEVTGRWEERGACDTPGAAGTRCPAPPGGRQGIQGGTLSPLPTAPRFWPGQAQGRSSVPSGHGRAVMDGTGCPHPHGQVPPRVPCPSQPVRSTPVASALTRLGADSIRHVQIVQRHVPMVTPSSYCLKYHLPDDIQGGTLRLVAATLPSAPPA